MRVAKTKRAQQLAASVMGACLVCYLVYHTVQGDRGWMTMLRLEHEVHAAEMTLAEVRTQREDLATRVQLLRPESIDPDLLEEKARELLNYAKPNEIVVIDPAS